MYENHRKNFYRGQNREFGDDRGREDQWRGQGRGRGEPGGTGRGIDHEDGMHRANSPYGGPVHDDFCGWYGGYGGYDAARDYRRNQRGDDGWPHEPQQQHHHPNAANYGYGAGQRYGQEGDSRYFTGQQSGWAVRSPYGTGGNTAFGADYREHGYGAHERDERGFWDRASDEVASWFGDDDAARRREMDHRGRGPKDYIRSDERIREDANDRLTDDPRVDASSITLVVQSGEITLNGTVPTREEKRRAEDCVDRISGVKHVQNNLRVSGATTSTDQAGSWQANQPSSEGGTINQGRTDRSAPGSRQSTKV